LWWGDGLEGGGLDIKVTMRNGLMGGWLRGVEVESRGRGWEEGLGEDRRRGSRLLLFVVSV
jgi:hypothetical protein